MFQVARCIENKHLWLIVESNGLVLTYQSITLKFVYDVVSWTVTCTYYVVGFLKSRMVYVDIDTVHLR